jgi:nucleotidyltransferase substrate binding protein (TIGR01987 family)
MKIDITYLQRSIYALTLAFKFLQQYSENDIEFDIYRSAVIKEFEIVLELSGKLLKKALKNFFHSPKAVEKLYFKDIFREAGIHNLITIDEVDRWFKYRNNRNSTSHDYGEQFANETLVLIEQFIIDAKNLAMEISKHDS